MRLFLSNSGSRMSRIVTTSCVDKSPARVRKFFLLSNFFGTTPIEIADRLIRHLFEPESSKTLNNLRLRMSPMVPAMQIVTGVSFLGRTFSPL